MRSSSIPTAKESRDEGRCVAGQIEAIGPGVTRFAAGDQVFGALAARFGAHAEYACLSEQAALAPKPANATYAEAAALADTTSLFFLRDKARLQPGQTILINGASGAVGAAAVQLATHFGAIVTGVCSGASTGLVRKLGAGTVIDYTEADFTRAGQAYDVIFDVAGTSSFTRCRAALSPAGIYLTTAPRWRSCSSGLLDNTAIQWMTFLTAVSGFVLLVLGMTLAVLEHRRAQVDVKDVKSALAGLLLIGIASALAGVQYAIPHAQP